MHNDITELVFVLDRSGSMHGLEADTMGGFNSLIEKQKQETGSAYVTTVLFDTSIERIHDRIGVDQVPLLTAKEYIPGGCTALLDAIGTTIKHIVNIHRYAREEDVPGKTVFVITTDGLENASRQYSLETIKRRIEHETEKYGWEFLFLGANIDAIETAGHLGIQADRATNFMPDGAGVELSFRSVARAVSAARCDMPMSSEWKQEVEADYEKRSKE